MTGALPVANGGTGAATLTGYVKGSGTGAMTASATIPGTDVSGNIAGNAANVTGTVALANGGTGATTKAAAFDALSPLTTLGDLIYFNGTDGVRLAGNTTATKQFLAQTGTGAASAVPVWSAIAATDVTNAVVNGGNTGAVTVGTNNATALTFETNGAAAMTVLSGGNVGIGTTSPGRLAHIAGAAAVLRIQDTDGAGVAANPYIEFYDSAGTRTGFMGDNSTTTGNVTVAADAGSIIAAAGSNTCTYTSGASWSCSSDERMKDRIQPLSHALDNILLLRGVSYHWRDPRKSEREHIGLIAQELERVYPQMVSENDETGMKQVDYSALISPLIEAVKELHALWFNDSRELHDEVERLKQENLALKEAVCAMNPAAALCQ